MPWFAQNCHLPGFASQSKISISICSPNLTHFVPDNNFNSVWNSNIPHQCSFPVSNPFVIKLDHLEFFCIKWHSLTNICLALPKIVIYPVLPYQAKFQFSICSPNYTHFAADKNFNSVRNSNILNYRINIHSLCPISLSSS